MKNDQMTLPEIFKKTYNIILENALENSESKKRKLPSVSQLDGLYELSEPEEEIWKKWCPASKRSSHSDRKKELIRAYFGEKEEIAKPHITAMLSALGVRTEGDNPNADYKYGTFIDASRVYSAAKITALSGGISAPGLDFRKKPENTDKRTRSTRFDFCLPENDYMYVVNTAQKIRRKTLAPANLGLDSNKPYKKPEDITNVVAAELDKKGLGEYTDFFKSVCDGMTGTKDSEKAENISALVSDNNSKNEKKISYDIPILSGDVSVEDWIAEFENDFGEVLGPLMLMDRMKNVSIEYPSGSNNEGYDYELKTENGSVKINAKGTTGSNSSIRYVITGALKDLPELSGVPAEYNEFMADFSAIYENKETIMTEAKKEGIIWKQTWYFVKKFWEQKLINRNNKETKDTFKTALSILGLEENENLSKEDIVERLDKIEDLKTRLKEFYDVLDYKPSNDYKPEDITKDWKEKDENASFKYGCVAYPLMVAVVRKLNNYKNYSNFLTQCVKKTLEYQVWTECELNKEKTGIKISFSVLDMKQNNLEYKFAAAGSVGNPFLRNISVKTVEKQPERTRKQFPTRRHRTTHPRPQNKEKVFV